MSTDERRQPSREILFLICRGRVVSPLVDELTDKLDAALMEAHVLCHGMTSKVRDGFIAIACFGFPPNFLQSLREDEDIIDCVVFRDVEAMMTGKEPSHDDQ